MGMESLALLPELQKLPAAEGVSTLGHDKAVSRIRAMDRDHFAIEVSQATEETLEALFDWRNVPDETLDDLNEAFTRAFSNLAEQGKSVHERFSEISARGLAAEIGFVSNLKGKVAELKAEYILEELNPGYDFELAASPTQPGWDLIGTSPDRPNIFAQVKFGDETYADNTLEAMREHTNYPFAVSSEIYDRISQSHPELLDRLVGIGPAAELTESVKDGLGTLAENYGVDVPDSIGEALPLVGEVVLGLKLVWNMVKTERELADVDLTDRTRVHGVRVLALASRFGINQVCMLAGSSAGAAAGTAVPGAGTVVGGLAGGMAGLGGAMMLNRLLEPRIEEVAIKLVGGDADDVFYLMNRVEIDRIGESLAATRTA